MTSNQVEEVKNKTDIVSLISEYIEVKRAGRNYKANCPFHGEKTPSFMITPELQMYKCFGCGRHGDVFTFLEEHEGMEFSESLKYLAEKAGITLTFAKNETVSEREKIIEINNNALNFYNYVLNSHPQGKKILEYLKKDRGLTEETIKQFKIGYSPESYTALSDFLIQKKKFDLKVIEKAGLLVGRGIDRFRGRVIFPLSDHRGNIVGFAGRILPWMKQDMAKYINSPDTEVYHKSKILFGLDITKSEIREKKYAVIVEGEIDMISSYQAGIKNVIAIKGSALTEDQINLIGRFAKKIVLCLDSDFAGDEAAKRGAMLAFNLGFEVNVAHIEGFKDPDEIARNDPKKYQYFIDNSVGIWDFLIDSVIAKYGVDTGEEKAKISAEIIPLISTIQDNIVLAHYAEVLSRRLSVPIDAVNDEIRKKRNNIKQENDNPVFTQSQKTRKEQLEEKLLINIIQKDKKLLESSEINELISSSLIKKIINSIITNGFPLPKELEEGYAQMLLSNFEDDDVDLIIKELTKLNLKENLEEIGNKLKTSSDNSELLKEFTLLSKKLSSL